MNRIILNVFFAFAFLISKQVYAQSNLNYATANRLYLGYNGANIHVNDPMGPVSVKGTNWFSGMNLGYEYMAPESFYFGFKTDMIFSGNNTLAVHYNDRKVKEVEDLSFSHFNLEFGYSRALGNLIFTPYAGIGCWLLRSHESENEFESGIGYNAYGLKLDYYFCPSFNLGVNMKVFRSYYTKKHFKSPDLRVKMHWQTPGAYVSFPVVYRFSKCGMLDVQLEPYFTCLQRHNQEDVYGVNLNAGLNF